MNLHVPNDPVNHNSSSVEISNQVPPPPDLKPLPAPLDFYARHGAALFPLPHGSKAPGPVDFWAAPPDSAGVVRAGSFKHHCSTDPATWKNWLSERPHCNFGVVGFASGWIIIDIDTAPTEGQTAEAAASEAWDLWHELCLSWEVPGGARPWHCKSARGGFHVYFQIPPGIDPTTLRQPDALKGRINVRVIGYTLAAGSFYDGSARGEASGPYVLAAAAPPPHVAPQALIEHCTPKVRDGVSKKGEACPNATRNVLDWMIEHEKINGDEEWRTVGMILRDEFGDDPGLELFNRICWNQTADATALTRWKSFALDEAGGVGIGTLRKMAKDAGCPHTIGTSMTAMFDGVAALVAAAPPPPGGATVQDNSPTAQGPAMPVPKTADELAKEAAAKLKAITERYVFETESDLENHPDLTWLAEKWIPERSTGIIYGWYGTGKSFIAFDLLLHLAYGLAEWHGIKLPGIPCYGLLIAREGAAGFKRRIKAFKKHHEITETNDRLVIMRSPANFAEPVGFEELKAAIKATGKEFKTVMVDTVGRALPGEDMFDPKSITRFMEHLQQLGELGGGVAIGIHHENKTGNMMGSAYFELNSDWMFHTKRDGDVEKDPLRSGTINCVKQKDGGEDGWGRTITYKFIATEANGEGSLVVDSISAGSAVEASKPKDKLTKKEKLALQALGAVVKTKGQWGVGDIGGRSVTKADLLEQCLRTGSIGSDSAKPTRDLQDRITGLLAAGLIYVLDDRVRLIGGDEPPTGNVIPMVPSLPSSGVPLPPGTPISTAGKSK
jgi:AAA domain/Bifunctional DNA primase/polymerase, N-terminal/Primase C terminal 2 (PriCT-2)